ncbi:uncharacterized protein [Leptinotarsa decemlineata]|uniref:uncharacterized protein n=1 Tax=Leptinotarsa decemlineata TaxID=7539 RepID=UPI003D30D070
MPASYFLGLEIKTENDGSIQLNQAAYTRKVLERFGLQDCKLVSTPIVKDCIQSENESEMDLNTTFPYREAVRALMYLMTGTRPDIAYAISVVFRSLEDPSNHNCIQVKRILRYLKGTTDYDITYKTTSMDGLITFSDADHGGDETGRSTTGIICMYAGGAISWLSQRQTSVAISSTEAEIVAASEASRKLIWLKQLYEEFLDMEWKAVLMVDNEAAIRLAQNPEYHRLTKHIHIRHFLVRELVLNGAILIQK